MQVFFLDAFSPWACPPRSLLRRTPWREEAQQLLVLLSASPSGRRSGAGGSREGGEKKKRSKRAFAFLSFFFFDERKVGKIEAQRPKLPLSIGDSSLVASWPMLSRGSSSPRFARLFPLLSMSSNATKKRPAAAEAKASSSSSSPRTPAIS